MRGSIFFGTFLVTLLCSVILPSGPGAEPRGGSATGHGQLDFGDDITRGVSFSAMTHQDGSVSGQIEFHDPASVPDQDVDGTGDPALAGSARGVQLHAEVDCLVVDGDTAIVGGQVTSSDIDRYVGKQVLLFVEDSEQSHGRFTWGFYEAGEQISCDSFPVAAYAPGVITGGSIQVR